MQLSAIKLVRPYTGDPVDKEKQARHHVYWQRGIDFIPHLLHQTIHPDPIRYRKERQHFIV